MKSAEIKGSEKPCKSCGQVKDIKTDFPLRSNHYLHTCSVCYNEQQNLKWRIRYRENPDFKDGQITRAREARWRNKYNVEPEVVYKTLEDQNYECANLACRRPITFDADPFSNRAVVDHDHDTGKFRALLCDGCNIRLGHIECNQGIFNGLLQYINKFS